MSRGTWCSQELVRGSQDTKCNLALSTGTSDPYLHLIPCQKSIVSSASSRTQGTERRPVRSCGEG